MLFRSENTAEERVSPGYGQLASRESKLRACDAYCRAHKFKDLAEACGLLLRELRKSQKADEIVGRLLPQPMG